MLVAVVGRSGAGKSTFIGAMGLPSEYHCVLSTPMVEEVKRRGQEVSHDTIHVLAKEWYAQNRMWQIEWVLGQLGNKDFLVLDGLRYWFELEYLRQRFPDFIVVKVAAAPENRFGRLRARGKISLGSWDEFGRLERDESDDMDLERILSVADIVVENNGPPQELQEKARRVAFLLKPFIK